jgi:glycosyltransferase involved in cell wall biosynthesis
MRIVHCLRAPVGGLFRHVLDLAEAQAGLGHQVGLIVDRGACDAMTEAKLGVAAPHLALGIARIPMPRLPSPGDITAYRAVTRHARGLDVDVLHGHGAKGGAYARLAGRALKAAKRHPLRVFYTPHGGTLHYPPGSLEGRVFMALERRLDALTDGIIFESGFAAETYQDRIGWGRAPRRVVHNGLKPLDFSPHCPGVTAADLLFVGELRDLKGVDVLLHAIAKLNAARTVPLTAVLVGAGPDGAAFEQLATSLGLDHAVTFPGAMPAARAFPLGRVMVVPSRKESLPYVVLEAAAAGMPVIATAVGGIPEIVTGTDTALVPPGDVDALAAAISCVMENSARASERAAHLKAAVAERFTVARMTQAIVAFYVDPK